MANINIANTKEVILFKNLYHNASKNKKKIFIFKNQEILTDYAKYLIMYIDGRKK